MSNPIKRTARIDAALEAGEDFEAHWRLVYLSGDAPIHSARIVAWQEGQARGAERIAEYRDRAEEGETNGDLS
jgi:hypothetical protein